MGGSVTITLHATTALDRVFYRLCGTEPPISEGESGHIRGRRYVRLLPTSWRPIHRWFAHRNGLFYLPCPLCDKPYGGQQSGAMIPDPCEGEGRYTGICPPCGRRRQRAATRHHAKPRDH